MTVPRAQVSTHRGRSSRSYPLTNYQFQMIAGSSLFFPMIHMKYVVFMSLWRRTIEISISNWPRTRKFSQFFWKYRRGRPFLTMVTRWSRSTSIFYALIGQNLTSELILKVVYFDSWSWRSFVWTCDVFNCLFRLDVQNEIQLLSTVFCYSWLVCLFGFWLRNASLVKIR